MTEINTKYPYIHLNVIFLNQEGLDKLDELESEIESRLKSGEDRVMSLIERSAAINNGIKTTSELEAEKNMLLAKPEYQQLTRRSLRVRDVAAYEEAEHNRCLVLSDNGDNLLIDETFDSFVGRLYKYYE